MADAARPAGVAGFRTFVILWITQSISVAGDFVTGFAVIVWLTRVAYPDDADRPQLAFALAALTIGSAVSALTLAPLFGLLVDRLNRRRTMLAMDLVNGCLSGTLAILALSDRLEVWVLLPVVWLAAAVSEFHGLAFDTSYALIVDDARLARANGMMQTTWALAEVLAAPVALGIIALAGTGGGDPLGSGLDRVATGTGLVFAVDALSFFVAAAALLFLRFPSPPPAERQPGLWREATSGARFIVARRPLLYLLALFAVGNFASTVAFILLPLIVQINLEVDWRGSGWSYERALAVVTTAAGIGGVAGGLVVSVWGGLRTHRVYGVAIPLVVASLLYAVVGLSNAVLLTVVAWGAAAFLFPAVGVHAQAIWQSRVPPALQGRVFAARRVIVAGSVPLGAALAGWLGGRFDPGTVVALCGFGSAVLGGLFLLSPALRHVEEGPMAATGEPVADHLREASAP